MSSSQNKLIPLALSAMQFSYSPYSQKKIGASLILSNGKTYTGCNIENASFGGTVCAERVAIWKAYSENTTDFKIVSLAVASEADQPWPPCGLCRQVISEFAEADTTVIITNTNGVEKLYSFKEIFPEAFGPQNF